MRLSFDAVLWALLILGVQGSAAMSNYAMAAFATMNVFLIPMVLLMILGVKAALAKYNKQPTFENFIPIARMAKSFVETDRNQTWMRYYFGQTYLFLTVAGELLMLMHLGHIITAAFYAASFVLLLVAENSKKNLVMEVYRDQKFVVE